MIQARSILSCLLLVILALVPTMAQQPHIILCMADDMGWGDPSYMNTNAVLPDGVTPHPDRGWIQTPNLDTMAANGLRFDRFYAAAPVCSPTRASCLTGRNPYRHGITGANTGRLESGESTLAELLASAGYATGHFGKWHLGTLTTLRKDSNRGNIGNTSDYAPPWEHGYDQCLVTEAKVPTHFPYRKTGAGRPSSFTDSANFYGTYYWRNPVPLLGALEGSAVSISEIDPNPNPNGDDSKVVVDEAIAFIQDAVNNQGKPFFAVVWFHSPHKPVVDPLQTGSAAGLIRATEDLDAEIGRLRDTLTSLGVRSNTMFWVCSDNGPEDGVNAPNESSTTRSIRSGGLFRRKRSLHEGGLRVPGILEWPDRIPAGRITSVPACTSDYYPTILDYLDLSVADQGPLDGISLRPLIEGTSNSRSAPIGFRYPSKKSWMNEQYKLIDDGGGSWALYDLLADPGERSPISTNGNPSATGVYTALLAEYTTWAASLGADTAYIHPSAPEVVLSTSATDINAPFVLNTQFSEAVHGLDLSDFVVENGTASQFSGNTDTYTLTITPSGSGEVSIKLPIAAAFDDEGSPSGAGTLVVTGPTNPPPFTLLATTYLTLSAGQTVDSENDVPGDDDNNLLKFTQGTVNDGVANPYTSSLFVRSSSGATSADRRVRALVRFDLSSLSAMPVAEASLVFNAHSLNDMNALEIEVHALAADWSASGLPVPLYNHPTTGLHANGGAIHTGLDAGDHTRDYRIDITDMVHDWIDGASTNYGIQLRMNADNVNNGIGIAPNGEGSIQLEIVQPLLLIHSVERAGLGNDLELSWNSQPGDRYRVEVRTTLTDPWQTLATLDGAAGQTTSYSDPNATATRPRRYYRVLLLP